MFKQQLLTSPSLTLILSLPFPACKFCSPDEYSMTGFNKLFLFHFGGEARSVSVDVPSCIKEVADN